MLERGIAVVTVGFPATVLVGGRVRFCVSAAHTREMLDKVLEAADICGHMCGVKISKLNPSRTLKEVKELEEKSQQEANFIKNKFLNGNTITHQVTSSKPNDILHPYRCY